MFVSVLLSLCSVRVSVLYIENRGPCKVRNETETKRNETKQIETKQMIWQAIVDKNRYFLTLENDFLILQIHFLILKIHFLI